MTVKYRKSNPETIEATQWFKNGDHPKDDVWRVFEDTGKKPTEPREGRVVRYYRRPDVSGQKMCSSCKKPMHDHGWIDSTLHIRGGIIVCPGDYVVTLADGLYKVINPEEFAKTYEAL